MQLLVTSSFYQFTQNCTDVFNAAEEAKLCSRPENYERNLDPSRTCAFRRLQPWRRRCAGLTCSSISLMDDAAIENLSKVQGPAAPGALLIGCDLLGCQFIPHRSSSEGSGGWSAAFHQVHSDIILGPQRFLPVITLAFKKEHWRTITRPARAFQLFRLSLPVSRIVGLFQLRHQRFMAARQAEVDAGIFNNVRKADLTNMKIPRWWRIPPIAG